MWKVVNVKEQFNPIASILSHDELYCLRDHIRSNNINQDESQEINFLVCWDDHKLGSCEQFLRKFLFEKKHESSRISPNNYAGKSKHS